MSGSTDQPFGNQAIGTSMSINSNMVMSINTGTMGRNSKLSDSVSASNHGRVIIDSYPKNQPKKQNDFNDGYYDIKGFQTSRAETRTISPVLDQGSITYVKKPQRISSIQIYHIQTACSVIHNYSGLQQEYI